MQFETADHLLPGDFEVYIQYVHKLTRTFLNFINQVMLMDTETTTSVSLSMPQSAIMKKEVFLFEYLHNQHQNTPSDHSKLGFLKCVVVMRPNQENVRLLSRELQRPRFGHYWIYLTNR